MDFDDTREEAAFRAEARAWLAANAEEKKRRVRDVAEPLLRAATAGTASSAPRRFRRRRPRRASPGSPGPIEWGGRALPPIYQVIYAQEESRYLVPRGYFEIGLGMCMPTCSPTGRRSRSGATRRRALRGDEVWCQLFSEPAAGSDLAGLRTRAMTRRRSVGHQRPEDLDFGRALVRLGHSRRPQ